MAQTALAGSEGSNIPFSILAQEIIDTTIDFLEDDSTSLKAAGLVQRSWYHRTREHLFREVVFRGMNLKARSVQLKDLLKASPVLVQYIKQLMLNPDYPFSNLDHVMAITPLLHSLTGFTVDYLNWTLLSGEVTASLLELLSNPRLHKVALINVFNIDIAPLLQFHNLRELVLWDVQPPFEYSVPPLNPHAPLPGPPTSEDRPRILDINGGCGRLLKTLIASAQGPNGPPNIFHPTTLKLGDAHFDGDMKQAWPFILERCGAFVQNYEVSHAPNTKLFPSAVFALRHLPKLRYFTTTLTLSYSDFDVNYYPLLILLEELNHLSQSGAPLDLCKFELVFKFLVPEKPDDDQFCEVFSIESNVQAFADSDFWANLNILFAKPAFLRLDTPKITFDFTHLSCSLSDTVCEDARTKILLALPNLGASPRVVEVTSYRPFIPSEE